MTLDNKQYMSAIDQADSKTNALGGTSSKVAMSLKSLGVALAAVAAAAAGALSVAIVKNTSELEQMTVSFEAMLGSAEAASVLLKDLAKFAKETPFELSDLQTYTKQLLAYGFAVDDLIPTLTTVGNISAGLGADTLPAIIRALGQIKAKGKLAGQEFLQLTETGIPLAEALSKKLGVSASEVSGNVADLNISYETVLETLQDIEEGKFQDLMIKQSGTLKGIWSNIKDTFSQLTWELGTQTGLYDLVKGIAKSILETFNSASPKIISIFVGISNAIKWIYNTGIPNLINGLNQIKFDILTALGFNPEEVDTKVKNVIEIIKGKLGELKEWIKQTFTSENILKVYNDIISGIEEIRIAFVEKIYNPIKKFWDEILSPLLSFWKTQIENYLIPAINNLLSSLKGMFSYSDEQAKFMKLFWDTLAKTIGVILVGAVTIFIQALAGITNIVAVIINYFNNMRDTFKEVAQKIVDFLVLPIKSFDDFWNKIKSVIDIIGDLVNAIFGIPKNVNIDTVFGGGGGSSWKASGGIIDKNATIVGENGPEIITGNRGARVLNNRETEGILRNSEKKEISISNTFNVTNGIDMAILSRELNWMYRRL